MVAALLAAVAAALPVQCDPIEAAQLLQDARIEEQRAPVSHAELLPGLALASSTTDQPLRDALTALCAADGELSLARAEHWKGPDWGAHTFLLSNTATSGCELQTTSLAITVAVDGDKAPHYALRGRPPLERTPVGECGTAPEWRDEVTVAGGEGPVRVVLVKDMADAGLVSSQAMVRRASRTHGWTEQELLRPAPERLLTGGSGPVIGITDLHDDPWVVAYGNRTGAPPGCEPRPGQIVWTWSDDETEWVPHTKRDALGLLAQRGLWRLAGQDAWLLVMAVEDEDEYPELLDQTQRRIQKRSAEKVHRWRSSQFPGLNPGFWVFTPAPFSSEQEAKGAKKRWFSWRRSYVKQAWTAPDPCRE